MSVCLFIAPLLLQIHVVDMHQGEEEGSGLGRYVVTNNLNQVRSSFALAAATL
jgi:hypothetical protein